MDAQKKGCKVEIDMNDEKVTVLQKKSTYNVQCTMYNVQEGSSFRGLTFLSIIFSCPSGPIPT